MELELELALFAVGESYASLIDVFAWKSAWKSSLCLGIPERIPSSRPPSSPTFLLIELLFSLLALSVREIRVLVCQDRLSLRSSYPYTPSSSAFFWRVFFGELLFFVSFFCSVRTCLPSCILLAAEPCQQF
jgi:hypothetical protein